MMQHQPQPHHQHEENGQGQHSSPRSSLHHAEQPDSDDGQMLSGEDGENDYDDHQESSRSGKRKRPISVSYVALFSLSAISSSLVVMLSITHVFVLLLYSSFRLLKWAPPTILWSLAVSRLFQLLLHVVMSPSPSPRAASSADEVSDAAVSPTHRVERGGRRTVADNAVPRCELCKQRKVSAVDSLCVRVQLLFSASGFRNSDDIFVVVLCSRLACLVD